jgi:hypothetical protein
MKKTYLSPWLMLLCLPVVCGTLLAKETCTVGQAEEYWKNNFKGMAIYCLNEWIAESPKDTKANFLLGKYCLAVSDFSCAEEKFLQPPVKQKYGKEIVEAYRAEAGNQLDRGNLELAKRFYWKIVGASASARGEACKRFYEKGLTVGPKESLLYFTAARGFCSNYNKNMGDRILSMAKNQNSREERNVLKSEARKYVSQERIDAVFPPPSWRTVFENTYTGRGLGDEGEIKTAEGGVDLLRGDRIVIEGNIFQVREDAWHPPQLYRYEKISRLILGKGSFLLIKAPEGETFTVRVERLSE